MRFATRSLTRFGLGCLALAAVAGCRPAEDPAPPAGPVVEEIPVTTSSAQARADFDRGRRLMDRERYDEANELFDRAAAEDPSFAYAHLLAAGTVSSAQEFNDSLKRAAAHLEGKSEGERLLVEISRTYFDNDAETRIALGQQLVGKYPHSPRAWLSLAGMQMDLNQHEAARASLTRALELDATFLPAHFMNWKSYLFDEPKDFARAEQAMRTVLEIDPKEGKAYESLGDVYRARNELEQARAAYTRAAELDPALSAASIKKGHIDSFLGRFDDARADYDAGMAGATALNRITYGNFRAFAHLHAGDPRAALDELAGLVAAADAGDVPEDQILGAKIFTLTNQATIALHCGFFADAESILEQLAAVMRANSERVGDPDFSRRQEANMLLWQGQLAARRGDPQAARAKAEAHRALLENDRNPRRFEGYHGILGLIELLAGNYPRAREEIGKSNLNEMYVKYHLALAEDGAGNREAAKKLFKEVGEWNFNSVGFALVRKDALARME